MIEDSGSDGEVEGAEKLLASMELSAETMAALKEFMNEERERQEKLEMIKKGNVPSDFDEIWSLSQFWYTSDTANRLAEECLRLAGKGGSIACISAPTIYRALNKIEHKATVNVFEYDTRFSVFGDDFVFYDYKSPLSVPADRKDMFDVVIFDPPYLEEDCLTKMSVTVKLVSKPGVKIMLCTGRIMQELASKLLGLNLQSFEIKHEKERLSNPYSCFANYNLDEFCKYN